MSSPVNMFKDGDLVVVTSRGQLQYATYVRVFPTLSADVYFQHGISSLKLCAVDRKVVFAKNGEDFSHIDIYSLDDVDEPAVIEHKRLEELQEVKSFIQQIIDRDDAECNLENLKEMLSSFKGHSPADTVGKH